MQILLAYNPILASTEQMARQTGASLQQLGVNALIMPADQPLADPGALDAIMVFGGDGTIIRVASLYATGEIPVLGVNMGTVGFLCSLEVEELPKYLPQFLRGEYTLDERMLLQLDIVEKGEYTHRYLALNEICVKSAGARMINLAINIDHHLHSVYKGDGLLVATPTGSTAYSLAAGGPVIDPVLEVILITPLLSYLLSKRPVVVAGEKEICLEGRQEAFISVDGQTNFLIGPEYKLIFRKAGVNFKLINVKGRDFFASVERRLGQNAALF